MFDIKWHCLWFLFLFWVTQSFAIQPILKFRELSQNEGLPENAIWTMEQDSDGFVWLGTTNGVYRYDGYEFLAFHSQYTFKNRELNYVRALYRADDGKLWVGAYGGLGIVNLSKQSIDRVNLKVTEALSLSDFEIYAFFKTTNNQIKLATNEGIITLSSGFDRVVAYEHQQLGLGDVPKVRSMVRLEDGDELIGTLKGLIVRSHKTGTYEFFEPELSHQLKVQVLYRRHNGTLLAGTDQGLFEIDEEHRRLVRQFPQLSDKYIMSVTEEGAEGLWVATFQNGLHFVSESEQQDYQAFAGQKMLSVFSDKDGMVWVSKSRAGLALFNPSSRQFRWFSMHEQSLSCLATSEVAHIFVGSDSVFWLGTSNGLYRVDLQNGQCEEFNSHEGQKSLHLKAHISGSEIVGLIPNPYISELLYVLTTRGVDVLNQSSLKVESHNIFKDKVSGIFDISHDSKKDVYLAAYSGFYRYNLESGQASQLVSQGLKNKSNVYAKTFQFSSGRVLISSWRGLLMLNTDQKLVPVQWPGFDFVKNPSNIIFKDRQETLWIGFDDLGLFRFSEEGKLIKAYRDSNKLPVIEKFAGILEDHQGNIWLSGGKNLVKLNPVTDDIIVFSSVDGFSEGAFNQGAFRADSGDVFFTGKDGFIQFSPNLIKRNHSNKNAKLTAFYLANMRMNPETSYNGLSLSKPVHQMSELDLSYKNNAFGMEFSNLSFHNANQLHYAYKLEPWDKDWTVVNAEQRRVRYRNVAPGDYQFRVKTKGVDASWLNDVHLLSIHIAPPFWLTTWAYCLYILLAAVTFIAIVKFRTHSLEKRSKQLEIAVRMRTQELSEEKSKVEQLLTQKNAELANVSHEFRTPLTLILGQTEQLLTHFKSHAFVNTQPSITHRQKNKLEVVQRNGYRLLRMVEQLLNMESFRVKAVDEKRVYDTQKLTRVTTEAFYDLAQEKQVTLQVLHLEPVSFLLVPDALEKILLNLISNAIKYTPKGGQITVCSFRTLSGQFHLQVCDTGMGIAAEKLPRIFDRFHRISSCSQENIPGAGIGLALVKELVAAHNGTIEVDSQPEQGSEFNVYLPIIGEQATSEAYESNTGAIATEKMSIDRGHSILNKHVAWDEPLSADNAQPLILIVEDNQDMLAYVSDCLSEQYRVMVAADGQQGLEKAIDEIPDLIISDLVMPIMTGLELTRALRSRDSTDHIPIILLTAKSDRHTKLEGLKDQVDEYLTKPFDIEELQLRVSNLLGIRQLLRRRFAQELNTQGAISESSQLIIEDKHQQFIDRLNQALEVMHGDPELTIPQISEKLSMSSRQLFRKLKAISDMTPREYLRNYRLEKSRLALSQGQSASRVALEVGFSSHSYFTKCFKVQYGCAPSEFYDAKLSN
ncbi:ATP-binding protein [Pleionea sp. CnH1-48]|uniref:hybrid sensor histidine kinase/response regulator transcription factor n=1 Tax=Pleionea sp. CnH1-48 TaxID=2954494 RepID=UPI002098382E|nr:ATP-binding protein [Pleionea sp. CnH1-48]MCO7226395.1 response regulator [Pleionea sp. CnH1-48]